ncbi:MAG: CpsD/CapB family tyrosine-protein kinase [Acidobacteriales bacterium]|nr:CpsD/CapB family tyrosine-protein kinase [Terriglobales bacterium]
MSRIYDALRKAEEEKQSQGVAVPETTNGFHHSAAEPAAEVETRAVAPAAPSRSHLATRMAKWSPEMNKLPSLSRVEAGADEFRRVRSRLYQLRDTLPLRSLLIASGLPGEGKSFVAANLAICLAQQECPVLLIDGDLRKPSLHSMLGSPSAPGLTDYLAGNATISQVIQVGNVPNLSFISGGSSTANAAELAGNRYMEQLIAQVSGDYEWIIVDSAPVVAVPDAVALARACDGVLIVACSANTPFDIAQRTVKEFSGSRVIGFLLNAVSSSKEPKRYAGYYYGYGPKPVEDAAANKVKAASAE